MDRRAAWLLFGAIVTRSAAYQLGVHAPAAPAAARAPCMLMQQQQQQPQQQQLSSQESAPSDGPSFDNTWYAVAFTEQLKDDKVFATRLWGEPIALYRDSDGEPVCVRDVCPHRSAPLSMGDMDSGQLRCFYHGWAFGKKGQCMDVPTIPVAPGQRTPSLDPFCATTYGLMEADGLLWVWRGTPLAADASKLPVQQATSTTEPDALTVDSTLDYAVDWSDVLQAQLSAPHLTELLEQAGSMVGAEGETADDGEGSASALSRLVLTALAKDGGGWASSSSSSGLFDEPNRVVHGSPSGSTSTLVECAHIVPIAPGRTRVLLRQTLPQGPLLSTLLRIPGARAVLTQLVQSWNQQGALLTRGSSAGSAAAEVARFEAWLERASEGGSAYFSRWDRSKRSPDPALGRQIDDDEASGTYGLKKNYVADNPVAQYAPMARMSSAELQSVQKAAEGALTQAVAALASVPVAYVAYKALVG